MTPDKKNSPEIVEAQIWGLRHQLCVLPTGVGSSSPENQIPPALDPGYACTSIADSAGIQTVGLVGNLHSCSYLTIYLMFVIVHTIMAM